MLVAVFLVTFLLAGGAIYLASRRAAAPIDDASPEGEAAEFDFDWLTPVRGGALIKGEALSAISLWDRVLGNLDGVEILKARTAEAGLSWSVGRLTLMMLLSAAATLAILWKMSWVSPWVAICLAIGAGSAPYAIVLRRRAKRMRRVEEQFPEALDSLARSLRAGNSLSAALDVVARETPKPLGAELRRSVEEYRLGANWVAVLEHLATRLPVPEVSVFAAAIQLQSRTGGKLHEVLAKLAETLREQQSLKGEVRSISAHGRLTGNILTALPIGIAIILTYVNPKHLLVLWTDPMGNNIVWAAVAGLVAARFVIARLVDIRI